MTVTYTAEVATCSKFGCFIKLLARWRGSIYKIIWMDLLLYVTLYYLVNLIYLYLLNESSKKSFESIVHYCSSYTALIPLSFVLGFYVTLVMTRWWEQYITIPWPDSIAVFVSAHVHGQDFGSRVMRRTVMRYVCVCLTIVFTMISPCVKKRFPKLKHLVDAGLLLENEKNIIETLDVAFPNYPKHWLPIVWAASIITRARKEGRIRDDFAVKTIIDELNTFRGLCGTLMYYDFICIPLVYTQVVTIAVYSFFVCSLLAHQWTEVKRNTYEELDFYLPLFYCLQFFFYMGWLKVAETLINPFGEDDDDFELNWMIDRNLQVSYLIVDEMHNEHPELVKDQYWDEVYPNELPYEAEMKRDQPPESSTAKYDIENPLQTLPKVPSPPVRVSSVPTKTRTSSLADIGLRSQRFTKAFHRFSDENKALDVEASLLSVTENVERITSYTPSQQSLAVGSQGETTYLWDKSGLDAVEEEEYGFGEEVEEEELLMDEEEEEGGVEIKESQITYESDSDSDPFERLRAERQQKRYDRMNQYLERNFGPNFLIVPEPNLKPDKRKKKVEIKLAAESSSVDGEILNDNTLVEIKETQILYPLTTSTPIKEADISKIPLEPDVAPEKKQQFSDPLHMPAFESPSVSQSRAPQNIPTSHDELRNSLDTPLELLRLTQDIATSPLGSARSMFTDTSNESDDWEVVSTQQPDNK